MTDAPATIGMRPPHPGAFIRDEILEPLNFTVRRFLWFFPRRLVISSPP